MRLYIDVSPCTGCTRVSDPNACENKNCQLWQRWFISRWDRLRSYPRRLMDRKGEPVGVPLGGNYYAAPHLTRAFMQKDPCAGCMCTAELCRTPCRARQRWAKAHEGVRQ